MFTEIAAAILDIFFPSAACYNSCGRGEHPCSRVMGVVHKKAPEAVLGKIKYLTMLILPDTREGVFELTST